MEIRAFERLACPLDGAALERRGSSWACSAGHSFDVARQGYLHLLPVQHKRSRDPGDSKEMVAARRRFLEAGHYRPIAAALAQRVLADAPARLDCLDAGCGEGYYLRELVSAAHGREGELALLGLDISKWAVQAAAGSERRAGWVVGTNARLPVLPASLDRLVCGFGFPVFAEFARVLRPGGRLLLVEPGPEHLRELREIIYPRLERAEAPLEHPEAVANGFAELEPQQLNYTLQLEQAEAIADLLCMTPHLYRASPQGRARAAALTRLTLTVDVRLRTLVLAEPSATNTASPAIATEPVRHG